MNYISRTILSAAQIRSWDLFTMEEEFISSLDLMEKAAVACLEWMIGNDYIRHSFTLFCGKGDNGGDGLAIARLLSGEGCKVSVYILEATAKGSPDFQSNLLLLNDTPVHIFFIRDETSLDAINTGDVIIDALFGSGLNRPLEGIAKKTVQHINNSGNEIIAIDIPSGMLADSSSLGNVIIEATHTLSFQSYKLAFLMQENALFIGTLHILNIGLSSSYLKTISGAYAISDIRTIRTIYKRRKNFSHKGTYGHAALIAGRKHMMGAAVLAAMSCLRSGAGKLTCYVPDQENSIMQISVPEAMTASVNDLKNSGSFAASYDAAGIGPGLGRSSDTALLLAAAFKSGKQLVIDADALNTIADKDYDLLKNVPHSAVLTPHPKEFERLFGKAENDFQRISLALTKAAELNVVIVLKGYHSLIAMPDGKAFFNTTGNPGMATAGSGDVLTGIITGLIAQKYSSADAAVLGVYIHGLAGDIAALRKSQEAMVASDITAFLGEAFLTL